jgi:hypothetical protein
MKEYFKQFWKKYVYNSGNRPPQMVDIKSIEYTGKQTVITGNGAAEMEIFAIIIEDKGVEKFGVMACKPEFKEVVEKAITQRLIPLRFDAYNKVKVSE